MGKNRQINSMKRQSLYFVAPQQVNTIQETIPDPLKGEVLVHTILSAISPGTELLVYRNQAPKGMAADATIEALEGEFEYPFKYGYSAVGEVIQLGDQVDKKWLGKKVFAFNPHESHFIAQMDQLHPLPEKISPELAVFLPNMETAVNFIMDGRPLIGERVAIFGQGIVGLLTTALLAKFPLTELVTVDAHQNRRLASISSGATASFDPLEFDSHYEGFDIIFELSGSPSALDQAISAAGFESRIVIGSWYGEKRANLDLGADFHRNRVKLISSQVSTVASQFTGRWNKDRRLALAWKMLAEINPAQFITQRFPISQAEKAFQLLDTNPQDCIQIVIEY